MKEKSLVVVLGSNSESDIEANGLWRRNSKEKFGTMAYHVTLVQWQQA